MSITLNLAFILLSFVLIMLVGREFMKLYRYLAQESAPIVREYVTTMMSLLAAGMASIIAMSLLLLTSLTSHGSDIY